jgi:hypothetical protein
MILEDFVMLGTTVPEPNSDGRVFVCSAGASEEYRKLVRIYPLARRSAPRRWAVHRVKLERNPRDSRDESFQVAGDRGPDAHQWINYRFEVVKAAYPQNARASLLSRYVIGSLQEANTKRLSLAIVQPDDLELTFELNPPPEDTPQLSLFDGDDGERASGARRFRWMPRLRFRDECGRHDLMLRDWGAFELQRKHEERYFLDNLQDALHLGQSSSLLVGNINNHRTTWLVVSVLNGLRKPATLFDAPLTDHSLIAESVRLEVYQRDEWTCVRCGSSSQLSVEPRQGRGVSNNGCRPEELETLCRSCILDRTC